jgi:hypothetical protein
MILVANRHSTKREHASDANTKRTVNREGGERRALPFSRAFYYTSNRLKRNGDGLVEQPVEDAFQLTSRIIITAA